MKIKNINIMFMILLLLAYACKEENEDPIAEFRAGSPFYKQDDNTYFKLANDSLYKYTPAGKTTVPYTIDENMNLSSSELNVSSMISETLFPDVNQSLVCLVGYKVIFKVKGKADGVVVFSGDSTKYGYSNRYEDFPYAQGMSLNVYNENQSDQTEYKYWYSGAFTATMIARNYMYIDADPTEIIETITLEILDSEDVDFVD